MKEKWEVKMGDLAEKRRRKRKENEPRGLGL